jgi:hypothetical protein
MARKSTPEREYEQAVGVLQKLQQEAERDATDLAQLTHVQVEPGDWSFPTRPEFSSADTRQLGHWETLARNILDLSQRPFETLVQHPTPPTAGQPTARELYEALGTLALRALVAEFRVFARTNQSGQPPERRRLASSYQPLLLRLTHLLTDSPLQENCRRITDDLNTLAAHADPDVATQAHLARERKSVLLRRRTRYELVILLFVVAVTGVIIIYYKSPLNTRIERGNSPFSVPIEERAGEARPPAAPGTVR